MIAGNIAHALLLHGEAFVTEEGEVLDPATVTILPQQAGKTAALTDADVLPDRVATHPRNRFHDPAVGNMGCRFNGVDQELVVEACVSEGWVRVGRRNGAGRLVVDGIKDYAGVKQTGTVELYWKIPLSRQVRRARARGKK